jgi:hypothetical protein
VDDPGAREEFVQVSALECDSIEGRNSAGPNSLALEVTLCNSVLEVSSSNARDTRYPEVISAFPQSLQANSGIVYKVRTTPFQILFGHSFVCYPTTQCCIVVILKVRR